MSRNRQNALSLPLPEGFPFINGGQDCDTLVGLCSCGAWHKAEDFVWRYHNQMETLQLPDSVVGGRVKASEPARVADSVQGTPDSVEASSKPKG